MAIARLGRHNCTALCTHCPLQCPLVQLIGIFFLHFATMWCGFFTEMLSRPIKNRENAKDYYRWSGDPDPHLANPQWSLKLWNYAWRMLPHTLGIFPYAAAWTIIVNNFNEQIHDLCDKLKDNMPEFVYAIVYGSVATFTCFTFVQWRCSGVAACHNARAHCVRVRRYQWTAPEHYWRTEVWYCALSVRSP